MGEVQSTARLKRLTDLGFTVAESRAALDAAEGDVDRAEALLRSKQQSEGGPIGRRINALLREQRPWDDFFARFLWPEHLSERVQTNLYFYRAKA